MTNLALFGIFLLGVFVVGMLAALAKVLGLLAIPLLVAWLAAGFAVGARRLHDRNKSAWWLLLFQVVPLVLTTLGDIARLGGGNGGDAAGAALALLSLPLSIWAFVELGCLKGTAGPNRFGPDPLGSPMQEVFA